MAFIDEITIRAKAGDGGDGVVRWLHERGKEFGGPAGGDAGRGGDVYALAVRNIHLLSKYRTKKKLEAQRGADGQGKGFSGADGEDLEIELPVGSIITNAETGEKIYLSEEGEKVLLLHGGPGGRGNKSFKSSTNRSPKQFTPGKPGEEAEFFIEVELIADIGLIGLPNAGKTTLLNAMTSAKAKIGDYPFTTLEPNLGEFYGYIISDIPGLIEGAAEGKGLGHKFLRHIRRTKILVHLISLENEDPTAAYKTIRKELERFDGELEKKKEIVVLTKTDLLNGPGELEAAIKKMRKIAPETIAITMYDDTQIKILRDKLIRMLSGEPLTA
ncbi:MAG: GTPase ObgE [bacterium]|nr:GTPase ObgE [bacterium]